MRDPDETLARVLVRRERHRRRPRVIRAFSVLAGLGLVLLAAARRWWRELSGAAKAAVVLVAVALGVAGTLWLL